MPFAVRRILRLAAIATLLLLASDAVMPRRTQSPPTWRGAQHDAAGLPRPPLSPNQRDLVTMMAGHVALAQGLTESIVNQALWQPLERLGCIRILRQRQDAPPYLHTVYDCSVSWHHSDLVDAWSRRMADVPLHLHSASLQQAIATANVHPDTSILGGLVSSEPNHDMATLTLYVYGHLIEMRLSLV